ncbi:MAG: FliA/WhiG family RNA polymerase sigma factor [Calditrichaeota bacterium]|nr:FliA/WhiG family RNA polymerase sigma factor [Calditrichota bacterium]
MKAINSAAKGWEAYVRTQSPELREQLLLEYLPMVRRLAVRLLGSLPRSVRLDDLVSAGVMGLLASIDNFDPSLGIKFETYAMTRIRGAMVDSLRELDWIPRSIRQKARRLEQTVDFLTQKLGRAPEDAEIAEHLELPVEEYRQLLSDVNVAVLLSLDDTLRGQDGSESALADSTPDANARNQEERLEDEEIRELLVDGLRGLPEQERLVTALYYYEELTLKEIGEVLGLTESRASQIHAKALLLLRASVRASLQS